MSVARFTPGPWHCAASEVHDKRVEHDERGARTGNTPNRICRVEYPYGDEVGQQANARLIASAPELYAALRGCAAALREAGKDFALTNPNAARPNLYELHAASAVRVLTEVEGQ